MNKLLDGVQSFQQTRYPAHQGLFQTLATGQAPGVLFLTCSDSRIDPNLITTSLPGELFVIRNAGNLCPPASAPAGGEAATLEYAVKALGVRDIVVCGHTDCGAVKAMLAPPPPGALPAVERWIQWGVLPPGGAEAISVIQAIEANVVGQIAHLRTYPFVQEAEAQGRLRLHGWVYHIGSGEIQAWDPAAARFEPLPAPSPLAASEA